MIARPYLRVSTPEQGADGFGLDAQRRAVAAEVGRRGWTPGEEVVEVASAKDLDGRPLLRALLADLAACEGQVLVIARLDRLARSTADFCTILDRAQRQGFEVLCLDPPVDMTTPFGRALAQMSAVFAELERALISQRTRDAIAAAKANGTYRWRESTIEPQTTAKVVRMRMAGMTWDTIADQLEMDGDEPPNGGRWSRRTLRRVVERAGVSSAPLPRKRARSAPAETTAGGDLIVPLV